MSKPIDLEPAGTSGTERSGAAAAQPMKTAWASSQAAFRNETELIKGHPRSDVWLKRVSSRVMPPYTNCRATAKLPAKPPPNVLVSAVCLHDVGTASQRVAPSLNELKYTPRSTYSSRAALDALLAASTLLK